MTARGIYDCRVNGQAVTDTLLNPGLTQYDVRIHYQTYDITDQLVKGLTRINRKSFFDFLHVSSTIKKKL